MRLAAACTNRKPLPGMETLEPFNIIYQTAEDGLGDTVKPRLIEADADLERVLVIDDRDTPLTLADERIARAIRENNARLVIIDPVQAFLGADVDLNRANEVRPIFRSLGDIAQATGCAIVLIGHLLVFYDRIDIGIGVCLEERSLGMEVTVKSMKYEDFKDNEYLEQLRGVRNECCGGMSGRPYQLGTFEFGMAAYVCDKLLWY